MPHSQSAVSGLAVTNTTTISAHINGGHNRFAILVNGSNPAGATASIETGDSLEVVTLLTGAARWVL